MERLCPSLHDGSRSLAPLSNHGERRLNRDHMEIIRLIGTGPRPNIDYRLAPVEGNANRIGDAGVRTSLQ